MENPGKNIEEEIKELGYDPETVLKIVHDIWDYEDLVNFALNYLSANVYDALIDGYEDDIADADNE